LADFWGIEPFWIHLVDTTFSPWSFWVSEMTLIEDPQEMESANPLGGEVALKVINLEIPTLC